MQQFEVKIEGVTPYMQHRMDDTKLEEWEKQRGLIIERGDVSKEDLNRAAFHAYWNGKGQIFLPAEHIRSALIGAGGFMKSKVGNAKKSMKNVVAAMFFVSPEELQLPQKFTVDKRSAVNKMVKARVIVIRPRWDKWETTFTLTVDNDTITEETIKELIAYAGSYVGIGSFRPTNNGYFGRFKLVKLKRIET